PAEVVRQWLELFQAEPDGRLRGELHGLALVLSELSPHSGLWRSALEGLTVTRSPFLESIRTEGRAQAQSEDLAELLKAKFPQQVSPDVLRRVEQSRDVDQLRRWFRAALDAADWEAFLRHAL